MEQKLEWIICPICGNKTRLKMRDDTIIENFPLYCPKYKNESLIDVKDMKIYMKKLNDKKFINEE